MMILPDGCKRCRSKDTGCSLASSLSIHSDDYQTGDHLPNNDAVVPPDDPSIAQKETRMKVVCHCDPHTTDSRYTSCEHHVASGPCAETEESHHLQQLALLRTRNAARPRTHSNHRASAVGCNDRTEFTFNMNATYRPGNDPTDSNVTISKSLHFDSISHTAQNAFLPQMMHIQSRFSADSLLVASQPDQPTACTAMTEPSCADLEAGTFIHQRVREDQNRRNM
ncbi:hypothetical protein BLNAU_25270 [Blattamonas nauphoetae]|uniref:Uncharacterized protein n=1 Tax=Blattamonas nauphoetae TaxID=2049346 RepID=A0ABQ9WKX7_9EUKA|nr:hypothetical protein BLNAU_25270 [Blattamonas nauphoetae]